MGWISKLECGIHTDRNGPIDALFDRLWIALAVGLTGIGGGSFTVPALVLIVGLAPGASVGTAFVFAGVLRLIAAPFYLAGRHVHWRYMWLLVLGAVPGLALGTYILQLVSSSVGQPHSSHHAWIGTDGFVEFDVYSPRAKSRLCPQEFELAPLAGFSDWSRGRIFISWRRRSRNCFAARIIPR